LQEVHDICTKYGGICFATKCNGDKAPVTIECKLKHHWESNLSELRCNKWCKKCQTSLKHMQDFAVSNGGVVLNLYYNDIIQFQCSKSHTWSSTVKNAKRKWCSKCNKDEKEHNKKLFEQQRLQKQKADEEL